MSKPRGKPFKKGQSGNPGGRPKTKEFVEAIRTKIKEADGDRTKLETIAAKLVEKAVEGDLAAIKEVADRLDGKPVQALQHGAEGEGGGEIVIRMLKGDDKL